MPLLKYDNITKKQVNKLLKYELKLDVEEDKEYKLEVIKNGTIYTTKAIKVLLLELYYLLS